MDLAGRVLATVRAHQMVPAGGRVLVAVSGGADSVTLLHLLLAIQDAAPLTVCGVVHLNHQLRPSADTDEAFCRALSARTGLPFVAERHDVAALARGWGTSVEAAGRRARYSWFTRAAAALGADVVATGHTRDDQAETYLLQLIRGAGPRGLAGIQPAGAALCRPLLDVRRAEVRDWVAERGVQFIEDPSNADLSFRRNRVRAELLPLLERRFSAGIVSVLARSAAIARRDADYLEAQARLAATRLVEVEGCGGEMSPLPDRTGAVAEGAGLASPPREVRIDAAGLTALPAALASRVVRFALGVLGGEHFVGADHVDRLLALAGRTSGGLSVPGQQARVRGGHLVLRRPGARAFANSFRVLLSIPGEVSLSDLGWAVSATWSDGSPGPPTDPPALATTVLAGSLDLPLAVRTRRRGDRFEPPGMGGRSRKLQDYFVDRRIGRDSRDYVPLVVDRDDRIVWVVGQGVAEPFRVSGPAQGVLFLKARRLGGPG